jgi:hypothetical protein
MTADEYQKYTQPLPGAVSDDSLRRALVEAYELGFRAGRYGTARLLGLPPP